MQAHLMTELKQRPGDQPLPVPNDRPDIQSLVIGDITRRREVGIQRYGTALQPHNGRDALLDLYEELLDACMYVKQVMVERDDVRAGERSAAVEAVALQSPPNKHSQMCPVWMYRARNVGLDRCNCWIVRNAERVVATVLTALDRPTRTPMALCRGCNALGAACRAEGGHCCDLCDHTTDTVKETPKGWHCRRCESTQWVAASLTGPVEFGGRAIKQCVPCGYYSNDPAAEEADRG